MAVYYVREYVKEGAISSMHSLTRRPVVAILTDFGTGDGDIGVMKGVIVGIEPEVQIIDITHDVAPQAIASGAWILNSAYRYFPAGTVFVCVVDPGVGGERRPVALHAGDWFFVGPDNGLFSYILREQTVHGAVALANPAYRLPIVSSTFHGRDIFAPAGAYLSGGASDVFPSLGPALDPATLILLPSTVPIQHAGTIEAAILHIDNFGNLITSIPLSMVPTLFSAPSVRLNVPPRGLSVTQRRRFFADGASDEQAFLYGDSSGYLGIAIRNGNAARSLGISSGTQVILEMS